MNDLLKSVDVEELLESLGVENVHRKGDEVNYDCPFPGHSAGGAASMNVDTTAFFCFGCKMSGNAITFVSAFEGVPPWTARRWLKERFGGGFQEPPGGSLLEEMEDLLAKPSKEPQGALVALEQWPEGILEVNWVEAAALPPTKEGPVTYMLARGLKPETMVDWEIGYDTVTSRLTIPVHERGGNLVGFKARAWHENQQPKYLVLGDTPGTLRPRGFSTYDIGRVVFGAHRCEGGTVVLAEGELNAIALWEAGLQGVAVGHSRVTPFQLAVIRDVADSVVVFFDDDESGRNGTYGYRNAGGQWVKGVVEMLEPFMQVKVVQGAKGDPADISPQERVDAVQSAVSPFVQSLV